MEPSSTPLFTNSIDSASVSHLSGVVNSTANSELISDSKMADSSFAALPISKPNHGLNQRPNTITATKLSAPSSVATNNSNMTIRAGPLLAPVAPRLVAPGDNRSIEQRKNEIVQEMVKRLRPFMSSSGQLRPDLDVAALTAVMAVETQFLPRTLLLTVLLNGDCGAEVYKNLANNETLIGLLAGWLQDSIKMNTPLIPKLLELFLRLPLTVDQLVEHKLGKSVKKLVNAASMTTVAKKSPTTVTNDSVELGTTEKSITNDPVIDKAQRLVELWTVMARQEDARRQSQDFKGLTPSTNTGSLQTLVGSSSRAGERRKRANSEGTESASLSSMTLLEDKVAHNSLPSGKKTNSIPANRAIGNNSLFSENNQRTLVVANMNLFNQNTKCSSTLTTSSSNGDIRDPSNNSGGAGPHAPLVVKSRAEQVLERVARGETSKVVTRPLSADDIHKEKRRQQYLQQNQLQQAYREALHTVEANDTADKEKDIETSVAVATPSSSSVPAPISPAKKRVSFATEPELVQVYMFEVESEVEDEGFYDQDSSSHGSSFDLTSGELLNQSSYAQRHHYKNAHEMEKNEASFAFRQRALMMEAELDWTRPRSIAEIIERQAGRESEERMVQAEREKKALSTVYFSDNDIPPSPQELIVPSSFEELNQTSTNKIIKTIPLRDEEGRVRPITRMVPSYRDYSLESGAHPSTKSDASLDLPETGNLLNSLLSNPQALADILKNVSTTTEVSTTKMEQNMTPSRPPLPPPPSSWMAAPSSANGEETWDRRQSWDPNSLPSYERHRGNPPTRPIIMGPYRPLLNNTMMPQLQSTPIPQMYQPSMAAPRYYHSQDHQHQHSYNGRPFQYHHQHHHNQGHSLPPSYMWANPLPLPPPPPPPPPRPPSVSSAKANCKYYRRGRPDSCRNGSNCPFYHATV